MGKQSLVCTKDGTMSPHLLGGNKDINTYINWVMVKVLKAEGGWTKSSQPNYFTNRSLKYINFRQILHIDFTKVS